MSNTINIQPPQQESWYKKWVDSSQHFSLYREQGTQEVQHFINNIFDLFRPENNSQKIEKKETTYHVDGIIIPRGMAGLCAKIETMF